MYAYTVRSGARYFVYQGRDDKKKHPESRDLWFYTPEHMLGEDAFHMAFDTASEAEVAAEEFDVRFQASRKHILEIRHDEEVKERRRQLRLIKSA